MPSSGNRIKIIGKIIIGTNIKSQKAIGTSLSTTTLTGKELLLTSCLAGAGRKISARRFLKNLLFDTSSLATTTSHEIMDKPKSPKLKPRTRSTGVTKIYSLNVA